MFDSKIADFKAQLLREDAPITGNAVIFHIYLSKFLVFESNWPGRHMPSPHEEC